MKFIRDIIGEKRQMSHQANGIAAANGSSSHFADEFLLRSDTGPEVCEEQPETPIEDLIPEDLVEPDVQGIFDIELQDDATDALGDILADFSEQVEADSRDAELEISHVHPVESFVAEPRYRAPEIAEPVKAEAVEEIASPVPPSAPAEFDADPFGITRSKATLFQGDDGDARQRVSAEPIERIQMNETPPQQPVDVPQPAMGRGSSRQGRVKTRLLGFNSGQDSDVDPIVGGGEAKAAGYTKYPVGWLIVTGGPGHGSAFTLFNGVSKIGRGKDQTVSLDFGDNSISRENHAAIAFDAAQKSFFIGHGGKANLVRRNDRPVLSTEELSAGDKITIGETVLRFVPLCGPDFTWEEPEEGEWSNASHG